MKLHLFLLLFIIIFISCKAEKKSSIDTLQIADEHTYSSYPIAKEKAYNWVNNLNFDLDYISNKKLGSKKFLAEYLGFYWKIYKNTGDEDLKQKIKTKLLPYYQYTTKKKYHNMHIIDDKSFKKNSMSYLRVMWLLQELDFDISFYNKNVKQILGRMNTHLSSRGNWQKEVFKEYYTIFSYKLPKILQTTKINNGVIDRELAFEKYKKNNAYSFAHFVFAAFEYGHKTTQNRFSEKNILYINKTLPKFTKYYREVKPNIDLLGEFVTCMVFMGNTESEEFSKSYQYLLDNQNKDGSWGSYEKHRKKIGNDIDFRAYLHTTLVVFEALTEYEKGQFAGSKSTK